MKKKILLLISIVHLIVMVGCGEKIVYIQQEKYHLKKVKYTLQGIENVEKIDISPVLLSADKTKVNLTVNAFTAMVENNDKKDILLLRYPIREKILKAVIEFYEKQVNIYNK